MSKLYFGDSEDPYRYGCHYLNSFKENDVICRLVDFNDKDPILRDPIVFIDYQFGFLIYSDFYIDSEDGRTPVKVISVEGYQSGWRFYPVEEIHCKMNDYISRNPDTTKQGMIYPEYEIDK